MCLRREFTASSSYWARRQAARRQAEAALDAGEEELHEIEIADPEHEGAQGGEPAGDRPRRPDGPEVITGVQITVPCTMSYSYIS